MTIAVDAPRPQSDTPRRALSASERSVLDALRARRTPSGAVYVKVAQLACATGMSERTVQRATNELLRCGYLAGIERFRGQGTPNIYRLATT